MEHLGDGFEFDPVFDTLQEDLNISDIPLEDIPDSISESMEFSTGTESLNTNTMDAFSNPSPGGPQWETITSMCLPSGPQNVQTPSFVSSEP